ncbi:MAG: serine/threonine protein kinase [Chloroflexi bacterium]|nr:serine/threonine protein kinase [Chloroflexota bacterium]
MISNSPIPKTIKLRNAMWQIGPHLGSGGFGQVFKANSEAGSDAVAKFIPKEPGASRELSFENLEGAPNIIPTLDHGEWGDWLVLVMPEAEKSLREEIDDFDGGLSLGKALRAICDIGKALAAIERVVVHRDLKPENILRFNKCWCISDFGISRYADALTATNTRKSAMTSAYAAPEQWQGGRTTPATDIYALGVIGFELLAGRTPFVGPTTDEFRRQHLDEAPPPLENVPAPIASLLIECLYKRPEARPTAQNVVDRLNHFPRIADAPVLQLQEANAIAVNRNAESERIQSINESTAARRAGLENSAKISLQNIARKIAIAVSDNAPLAISKSDSSGWRWSLNDANLSLSMPVSVEMQFGRGAPFEVVAKSVIGILIPQDEFGYDGRSHSLWYCAPFDDGTYRWHEFAFMDSPLINRRSAAVPFALDPNQQAFLALAPGMHVFDPAWTGQAIDQGDEGDFVKRWLQWFGEAAQGKMARPRYLPEETPSRKWTLPK